MVADGSLNKNKCSPGVEHFRKSMTGAAKRFERRAGRVAGRLDDEDAVVTQQLETACKCRTRLRQMLHHVHEHNHIERIFRYVLVFDGAVTTSTPNVFRA